MRCGGVECCRARARGKGGGAFVVGRPGLSWAVTEGYVTNDESELVLRRWASGVKPAAAPVIADGRGRTRRTRHRWCGNAVAALLGAQAAARFR